MQHSTGTENVNLLHFQRSISTVNLPKANTMHKRKVDNIPPSLCVSLTSVNGLCDSEIEKAMTIMENTYSNCINGLQPVVLGMYRPNYTMRSFRATNGKFVQIFIFLITGLLEQTHFPNVHMKYFGLTALERLC